jgi:hypothetical protein
LSGKPREVGCDHVRIAGPRDGLRPPDAAVDQQDIGLAFRGAEGACGGKHDGRGKEGAPADSVLQPYSHHNRDIGTFLELWPASMF